MICQNAKYLFLALFLIVYGNENMQNRKNANLLDDIKSLEYREAFLKADRVNSVRTMSKKKKQ